MRTTVVLTQGHISIRRGRVTRQYLTLTKASFRRLTRTCGDGPTDYLTTNRSVIYIWHGLSTLTADQRKLYDLYHDMSVDSLPGPRPVSPSGIEWMGNEHWVRGYLRGISTACQKIGIHKLLLHPDFYTYDE